MVTVRVVCVLCVVLLVLLLGSAGLRGVSAWKSGRAPGMPAGAESIGVQEPVVSLSQCCRVLSCAEVLGVLLPHLSGVVTERAWEVAGRVFLLVRPAAAEAACPGCGQLSGRRHGG